MFPHKNQVNFDPQTKPSISLPPPKNKSIPISYTQVKRISIPTMKSSQLWCRDTKNKLISISTPHVFHPTLKPSQFRTLQWNQVKFDPTHKPSQFRSWHDNQAIFDPSQKTSEYQPPYRNQITFDRAGKTKAFSTPTPKPSQLRSLHWNQGKFNPPHWNQVNIAAHP